MSRPQRIARSACLVALALAAILAVPAGAYDWRLDWRTIETDHFYIHYDEKLEAIAQHTANVAERTHEWLTAAMGWEPRWKAHVVLSDDVDYANGVSNENPYRTIRLYVSQPADDSSLDSYKDWIEILFTHEYTHSIHLDTMYGVPQGFRSVFGRLLAINEIQPRFMTEGLAVYFETLGTGYGRGQSTDSDMMIRAAILEDRFQPIDRWTTFNYSEWPGSAYPYIFGGRLHLWIAEHYGHKFDMVSRLHARQIFPFRYDADMEAYFGKSWDILYDEFKDDVTETYEAVRERVEADGLTRSRKITTTGYSTRHPRFSPNGFYLAWLERTNAGRPRIKRYDLDNGKVTVLHEARSVGPFDWSPTGRQLLYERVYPYDVDYEIGDLFLYDTYTKKRFRLTSGARALEPDVSPVANEAVFVYNHDGTSDLALVDIGTRRITRLTANAPLGPQYSGPRFSPDGKTIAVGARIDGNRDIYLFDVETRTFTRLTEDPAEDRMPVFSPEGRTLYFSSDRSGISNIYAIDLETRETFRVTNVLGGATQPDVSPDGTLLAFAGYSSTGWDIHLMTIDRADWVPVRRSDMVVVEATARGIEAETAERVDKTESKPIRVSHPYRPWSSIWPRWWFPVVASSNDQTVFGFEMSMSDAVREHSWGLSAIAYPETPFAGYNVYYSNAQWYPTFTVRNGLAQVYLGRIIKTNGSRRKKYFERRYTGSLAMSFDFTHELSAAVAFGGEFRDELVHIPSNQGLPPDVGWFLGPSASIAYNNAEAYGASITGERGGAYSASVSVDDALFGSDFDIQVYRANLVHYFGIARSHHVFVLRAAGGYAAGDRLRSSYFRLGGYEGFHPFDLSDTDTFYLRGFEASAFRGQQFAAGSFEYRFPIYRIERGIRVSQFWFDTLSGTLFGDAGHAWTDDWDPKIDKVHPSAGVDVLLRMTFAYRFGISLRTGVAQGLDDDGIFAWHVTLGGPF